MAFNGSVDFFEQAIFLFGDFNVVHASCLGQTYSPHLHNSMNKVLVSRPFTTLTQDAENAEQLKNGKILMFFTRLQLLSHNF